MIQEIKAKLSNGRCVAQEQRRQKNTHIYVAIQKDGFETIGCAQLSIGYSFYCSLALQVGIYLHWRSVSNTILSIARKRTNKNAY